jgi:hypothetical protein
VESREILAVGPLLVAPTATNRFLGQGKWQAGLAGVDVHSLSDGSLLIGILTWQHSFAGEHTRPDAQVPTFQPIAALSVGGGYYVRSSGIWSFDIVNVFIEPQSASDRKRAAWPTPEKAILPE